VAEANRGPAAPALTRTDGLVLAVLLVLALVYYLSYLRCGLNLSDEGYVVMGALRVLDGQVPGADFHSYAPGRTYLLAALFDWLGASIGTERAMWVAMRCLVTACHWWLARQFLPRGPALALVVLCALVPGPWHKTPLVLGLVGGALLLVWLVRATGLWKVLLIGIGIGALGILREETGVLGSVVGVVVAFFSPPPSTRLQRLARVGVLVAGVLLPALLFAAGFATQGRLADAAAFYWLEAVHTVVGHPGAASLTALPGPGGPRWPGGNLLGFVFLAIPLASTAAAGVWLAMRGRQQGDPALHWLALLGYGLLCCVIVLGKPDPSHVLQVLPIQLLITVAIVFVVWTWNGRRPALTVWLVPGGLAAMYFVGILGWVFLTAPCDPYYTGSIQMRTRGAEPIAVLSGTVFVDRDAAEMIQGVREHIERETRSTDPIFVYPYVPMLYVLTDRENPTRYDGIFPHALADAREQERVVRDLESGGVRLIVVDEGTPLGIPSDNPWPGFAPVLEQYLQQQYLRSADYGPDAVYLASP